MAEQSRLAKFIDRPGGLTFEAAVDRAELGVQMVQGDVAASVNAAVEHLQALVAALPRRPTEADLRALLEPAAHVAGHAALYGRDQLGRAAYMLCELIDHDLASGHFDPETIHLHIHSMEILRLPGAAASDRARTIQALGILVDRARKRAEDAGVGRARGGAT